MEKTLIKITKTDIGGVAMDVNIHDDRERIFVATSLSALLIKDKRLAIMFTEILETNIRHPEILEKNSIIVEGGVPWDNNKPNNQ